MLIRFSHQVAQHILLHPFGRSRKDICVRQLSWQLGLVLRIKQDLIQKSSYLGLKKFLPIFPFLGFNIEVSMFGTKLLKGTTQFNYQIKLNREQSSENTYIKR